MWNIFLIEGICTISFFVVANLIETLFKSWSTKEMLKILEKTVRMTACKTVQSHLKKISSISQSQSKMV